MNKAWFDTTFRAYTHCGFITGVGPKRCIYEALFKAQFSIIYLFILQQNGDDKRGIKHRHLRECDVASDLDGDNIQEFQSNF